MILQCSSKYFRLFQFKVQPLKNKSNTQLLSYGFCKQKQTSSNQKLLSTKLKQISKLKQKLTSKISQQIKSKILSKPPQNILLKKQQKLPQQVGSIHKQQSQNQAEKEKKDSVTFYEDPYYKILNQSMLRQYFPSTYAAVKKKFNQTEKQQQQDESIQIPKDKEDKHFRMFQMMIMQLRNQRKKAQQSQKDTEKTKNLEIQYLKYGLISTGLGLLFTFIGLIAYNVNMQDMLNEWWKRKQLINEYGTGQLQLTSSYLQGNSIQKQFEKIMKSQLNLIHFLIGIPGSGKTSAMVYLINKMRREGKKVYYINLRVEDSQGNVVLQQVLEKIKDLQNLIKAIFYKPEYHNDATIVIDNIHLLQFLKDQMHVTGLLTLLTAAPKRSTRIIVISSSSYFYDKAQSYSFFQKALFTYQIQILPIQQRLTIINNLLTSQKNQNMQLSPEIINYIAGNFSMRFISRSINLLRQIRNDYPQITQKQMLQYLKSQDEQKIQQFMTNIELTLAKSKLLPQFQQDKIDIKFAIAILKGILNLNDQIRQTDYCTVKQYLQKQLKVVGYLTFKTVIDSFCEQNMLLFCHPETRNVKIAFQRVLDKLNKIYKTK